MQTNKENYLKYNQIGMQYLGENKLIEAKAAYTRSLEIEENFDAYTYLAIIYDSLNEPELAINAALGSLKYKNDVAIIYKILGYAFFKLDKVQEAFANFHKTLALDPGIDMCNYFLGEIRYKNKEIMKAIKHYRAEIAVNPNFYGSYIALGNALIQLGFSTEGVKFYKQGTRMNPSLRYYNFLLYMMAHDPQSTEEDIYNLTLETYEKTLKPIKDSIPQSLFTKPVPEANPNKKLRIGLVSPNFKLRSAEMWLRDVFANLAKESELFFYHCNEFEDDATQKYFKSIATGWHNITNLDDAEAAKLIREDQIDILVDLIGHVLGNRISLFLYEAAPVQVNWLHYFATTGMPEIGYMIVDKHVVPDTSDKFYTEKLYKMPNFLTIFSPKPFMLDINDKVELPVKKNGYITFANLGRFHKIHDEVLETWAQVLNQVENSKLLLACKILADKDMVNYLAQFFEQRNISKERIIIEDYPANVNDFLMKHKDIDIILDTFPFSGATTMYDACWMGVPTIMLYSDRWSGRGPVACLEYMGTKGLVAHSKEDYVSNAVNLAKNHEMLEYYRNNLRNDMLNSPFCDDVSFSRDLSIAFREIWKDYCNSKKNND